MNFFKKSVKNDDDAKRLLAIRDVVREHNKRLFIIKTGLSESKEKKWPETKIEESKNMIKVLSAILNDLEKCLK